MTHTPPLEGEDKLLAQVDLAIAYAIAYYWKPAMRSTRCGWPMSEDD